VQVTLDEFLIRDGRASDQSGGAIRSVETDSSLLLTDTDVRSSRTNRDGGGIHARGAVTIERGRFSDNTARDGGAIESHGPLSLEGDPDPGATPEFEDNTALDFGGALSSYGPTESIGVAFTGNSSEFGGAIANDTALLTIDGGSFSANEAALRGGAIESDGDVVVSDATLENQKASVGAGIATDADASATIESSELQGNRAETRGGGVSTGSANVTDTSFESNRAVTGGAIFTQQGGTASESEFLANTATGAETGATVTPGLGGAILSSSGPLVVDHSTFDDNRAGLDVNRGDGVLHVSDGDLTMSTSTVSRNTTVGSAVSLDGGGLELENSTVADNRVVKGGAAIRVLSEGLSPSTVSHATIAGNVVRAGAGTATGGIEVDAGLTLERSILAFNSVRIGKRKVKGSNCALPETITSGGHNLETYNGCGFVPGAPDFDLTSTNPLLAPLSYNGGETNTMGLYDTSPAIDAVADCPPPPFDQRDVARPAGQCDIGAFEGSLGAPTEDCKGRAATIVGTRAADTIVGTSGPDVIVGLAGRDTILGAAGNDRICGDAGRDDLRGGSGRNRIFQ
jgi:predicted outer membrane repeat protein